MTLTRPQPEPWAGHLTWHQDIIDVAEFGSPHQVRLPGQITWYWDDIPVHTRWAEAMFNGDLMVLPTLDR